MGTGARGRRTCRLRPDLVVLDVQMPDGDGFELLERLDQAPAVILTTAFDRHALRAFEVNALDHLVKPIAPDRLAAAVARAVARAAPTSPALFHAATRLWPRVQASTARLPTGRRREAPRSRLRVERDSW